MSIHTEKRDKGLLLYKTLYPYLSYPIDCLLVFEIEASAETLHTTSGVKDTLLPSEEWMAARADIYLQNRLDAHCFKAVATSTTDCGFNIIWMNSFFHGYSREIFYFQLQA